MRDVACKHFSRLLDSTDPDYCGFITDHRGLLGLPGTLPSRCCSLDWLPVVAPWFGFA